MTQEEKWMKNYLEVMGFMEAHHRNPSKHRVEEHLMLNWIKHNRKVMNKGELKPERAEKFQQLLELAEQYKRKNQYE